MPLGRLIAILLVISPLIFTACSSSRVPDNRNHSTSKPKLKHSIKKLGHSIQVGAFSNVNNAVRFEGALNSKGIDAFHFLHKSGLYKVRFGDFNNYTHAKKRALQLQRQGLIGNFFVVDPETYSVSELGENGEMAVRESLVKTAERFLGVPYRWGGTCSKKGFDCSGLTLTCYRLNGLDLPRVSYNQAKAGRWISKKKLKKGDLVFFATRGGSKISHVGMYIGSGNFIHAPKKGQRVRVEKLSNSYFSRTYMGGRSYL